MKLPIGSTVCLALVAAMSLGCTEEQPSRNADDNSAGAGGANSTSGSAGMNAAGVNSNVSQAGSASDVPLPAGRPSETVAGQPATPSMPGGQTGDGGAPTRPSMAGGPNIISPAGGSSMSPMGGRPMMRPNDECGRNMPCPEGEICAPSPNGLRCQADCRENDIMCPEERCAMNGSVFARLKV